jgi:nucleoside 2-deoxyribosyltransferase
VIGRPIVYLAGPYSTDPVGNTRRTIRVADQLVEDGWVPYVPHLSLLWDIISPYPAEHWYAYDLALMVRCDVVLRLPGESYGADEEARVAAEHGIPVVHSLTELEEWRDAR